jgi:hypothetical protein
MAELKLYSIDKKVNKRIKYINKLLPSPEKCLRWIMLGPSGSGKSTLMKNIVLNDDFGYNKYFDEIYLFLGSLDDIHEMEQLLKNHDMNNKVVLINELDLVKIKNLMKEIEKDAIGENPPEVLMIFDDLICEELSKANSRNVIDEIWIRGRHCRISAIISTQKYRFLNQNMRVNNSNVLTMFHGLNHSEIMAVSMEHCRRLQPEEVAIIIKGELKKKYDFMSIDYTRDENDMYRDKLFQSIKYNFIDE